MFFVLARWRLRPLKGRQHRPRAGASIRAALVSAAATVLFASM
jgi:hypothetical protein